MAEPTTLFWDIGGVVLTNGWDRPARQKAAEKFHLDWDDFEDRHELLLSAFETGKVTLADYLKRTVFYRERPFTQDDFKDFLLGQSQAFPETLGLLRRLSASRRYLIAALNNESLEINEYRIRKFRLRDFFEVFLSSCYLGLRKPDGLIYRRALNITQREPGECVFIDDRSLNLECAREIGMRTIQFRDVAGLREELERAGVALDGN